MRYLRVVLVAAIAAATLLSGPAAHAAGTPIASCGQTVTTNAVLTQNLVCTGDGIVVGAAGVTIDLHGFIVRGDRDSGDTGINDSGGWNDVTVKNGVVRNFDFGIYAAPADGFTVSSLTVAGNLGNGIYVQGTDASVTKATVVGNGYGISLVGDGAKITSSTAARNAITGMLVVGGDAVIKSSTATANQTSGIVISGSSGSVTSSTGSANGAFGIFVDGDFDSVKSSTAVGNGNSGIEADGFSDAVGSSTASENTGGGIHVDGDAATIAHNRAEVNGFDTTSSDLMGLGIFAENYTTPPVGSNTAHANDDPAECAPASLC